MKALKKGFALFNTMIISSALLFSTAAVESVYAEELTESVQNNTSRTGLGDLKELDTLVTLSSDDVAALNDAMAAYVPNEDSLLRNEGTAFYYYDQIEPLEQEMYDIMLNIAKDPVTDNIGVMMTDQDPSTDEFYLSFMTAYYAMVYDHAELFWLYQSIEDYMTYASEVISQNGIYIVYFGLAEEYTNYQTEMTKFNQAVDEFLSTIDTTVSQIEIARQVHDKLISLADYNHPVCDDGRNQDLAHTAYGALVEDSYGNANAPVCDGYSQAFIYLLQQCGIEGALICGDAGDSPLSLGGHAWSVVNLDGNWFEVDSTWDDHDDWDDSYDPYSDYLFIEALNNASYRNKLDHYLFLVSTETITDYESDNEYFTYYASDGSWVYWDMSGVHYRWSSEEFTMNPAQQAVNALIDKAPVAQFTYQTTYY